MKKNAALYLRSSKDRKDVSPDAQRRALTALAEERGLTVVEEFIDAVESGKDENRPGFQRLKLAVRNPNRGWSTVLMHDTSRLSRRRVISMIFEEIDCKRNGVTVVYRTLPDVDPLTEIVLKSVMVAWDEYHSVSSKQKGLAGMGENVRAGFRAGGRAPTGYRLNKISTGKIRDGAAVTKSVLELDPETADGIGKYLRARAAGEPRIRAKRQAGIADMKDTTLISVEWNALTYAGHTVWNVHAEREDGAYVGGSKRRPRSEWLIQRDTHPALITDDEAEQLLGRLELQAKSRAGAAKAQRDRDSDALLGGMLFTPAGGKWWAEADRYRCAGSGRSISRATIEAQVIDQVLSDIATPDFAPAMLKATRAALASDTDPAALRAVEAEVARLAEQISRTLDLAAQLADPAPALRKIEDLERQRAERVLHLQHLQAEAERASWISKVSVADVQRVLANLAEDAKDAGRGELLRPVILSVVERVEIDPETLSGGISYRVAAHGSRVRAESDTQKTTPDHKSGVNVASPRGFELNPRLMLAYRRPFRFVPPPPGRPSAARRRRAA